MVTLNSLSQDALIRIMTEPKNALVKQYQKLFALDGVELDIEKSALESIARKAIERKTGAARCVMSQDRPRRITTSGIEDRKSVV